MTGQIYEILAQEYVFAGFDPLVFHATVGCVIV